MDRTEQQPRRRPAPGANDRTPAMEVRQLRTFVTLVDAGSMTAAAQSLGVAQSTVSEGLLALERALGTRVVVRQRGAAGARLTPAGAALLPHARHVLASLTEAQIAVAAVAHDARASIEIIANESVSTYLLPGMLGQVRPRWPNTRFAVTTGMCPAITDGLASGRYDVGLMLQTDVCPPADAADVSAADMSSGGAVHLSDVPLILFCRTEHPLASRTTRIDLTREQLLPYTVFVSDARGYFFDCLHDYFRPEGVPGPRMEPTGSVEAVKLSVANDRLALGVLPAYALVEEVQAGRVSALPVRPALPTVRLEAMLYGSRPSIHPALAELLDLLRIKRGNGSLSSSP
jgi:DNA-binding transcriptional LysR family regulator